MQSNEITATAGAISSISNALTGSNSVECVADTTVPPIAGIRPTWLTNVTYWIPQEFGSTWLPKVFVGPSGAANIEATGTQIFSAGISGSGEYYFDTQAGVLNFIGETTPTALTSGNVVYVSGYQYVGAIGVTNQPGNVSIGNLQISGTTITTDGSIADITIEPTGNGLAIIDTTTGFVLPVGNTAQRPSTAIEGTVRFNSQISQIEVYDGVEWDRIVSGVTNESFDGDGSTVAFTLDRATTSSAALVMLNGVVQLPETAYNMTPNPSVNLVFTEPPAISDKIDVRFL
jgi:hypothetical protein